MVKSSLSSFSWFSTSISECCLSCNKISLALGCFCKMSANHKDPLTFWSSEQTGLHRFSCLGFLYANLPAGCDTDTHLQMQLGEGVMLSAAYRELEGFTLTLFAFFFNRSQAYGLWKRSFIQPQAIHWWRWALSHSARAFCLRLPWHLWVFFFSSHWGTRVCLCIC